MGTGIKILTSPLDLGKEIQVASKSVMAANSETYELSIDAESVLVSLFVNTTAGDVDVNVTTEGKEGHDVDIINFPTVSAPTTDLLLRKAASALRKIRITITTTDAAEYEVRVRGVTAGAASFKLIGNENIRMSQIDIGTTATALIPASLTDRASVAIKNYNITGVLYLGGTAGEATTSEGWPVGPQESYVVDVAAGQAIYGVADSGTIDVRVSETGG